MDFFGISPLELLVILIVGLIVFGPDKLPELARNIARVLRNFRKVTLELTREVTKEFNEIEAEERESEEKEKEALASRRSKKVQASPEQQSKLAEGQSEAVGSEH